MPLEPINMGGTLAGSQEDKSKLSPLKPINMGGTLVRTPGSIIYPSVPPTYKKTDLHGRRELPSRLDGFVDGFVEDMTFGKIDLFTDEEIFASKAASRAYIAGTFLSFGAQAAALSSATMGAGGVTLYTAKAAKLANAATKYTKAMKSFDKGKITMKTMQQIQTKALTESGVGTVNSIIKWGGPRKKYMDTFMKIAADNPAKARRFVLATEVLREGSINAALGQKFVTEENLGRPVTIQDRLKYGAQDLVAGGFFGAGRAYNFAKGIDTKMFSKEGFSKTGLFAFSGFTQSLAGLEGSEDEFENRLVMAGISAVIGQAIRGGNVTKAKDDVQRAMKQIGVTDEKLLAEVTDLSLTFSTNKLPKVMSDKFKGLELTNTKTETTSIVDEFFYKKIKDEKYLYTRFRDSKSGKVIEEKTDDFFKKHRKKDWEEIDRIKQNFDKNDKTFSMFKDEGELKHWLKTNRFGIVTAEEPRYVGTYGHEKFLYEDANDELVRTLLAKGYKRNDIMATKGHFGGKPENSFIVKNLKQQDAVDIARQFGQESVATHKGLTKYSRKGGNTFSLDIEETSIAKNMNRTKFGDEAKKKVAGSANYTSVKYKNKTTGYFKIDYDFNATKKEFNYNKIPNKYVIGTMNDVLDRGIHKMFPRYNTIGERKRLVSFIKQEEIALGLDDKQKLLVKGDYYNENVTFKNMQHISLKKALFNKTSTTRMNNDELKTYASLLSGREDIFAKRLNSGHIDTSGISLPVLDAITVFKNSILPLVTKYTILAKELKSKTLAELANSMKKYSVRKYETEGSYQTMRYEMKEMIKNELGLFNVKKRNQIDKDLMFFIEQGEGFKQLRNTYKGDKQMLNVFDTAVGIHTKWSDDMYAKLQKAGVMQFDYVKDKTTGRMKLKLVPIQKQKNFVSRQITEEMAELFENQQGDLRQHFINQILRTDKRFRGLGEWADVPKRQQREMAEEMLGVITDQRAKYGVYGQQFARVTDLDPRMFLDANGRIIKGVKKWDYKVGDMIGKDKVAKVIDVYDLNYGANMDRYATKIGNMLGFTEEFGAKGIFQFHDKINVRTFTEVFNKKLGKIQGEIRNQKDRLKIAQSLDSDFKVILGGDNIDELVDGIYKQATSWTASVGLSGLRSGPKNFLLGQTQLITNYGLRPVFRQYFHLMTSKSAWKDMWKESRAINALQSSERAIETAIQKTGITGKIQKGLTTGMRVTEQVNRGVSVATGVQVAEDALKILSGKGKVGFFKKMNKNEARRLLADVFELSDDTTGLAKAIETGQFSNSQRSKIRFMSHATTQGLPDPVYMPRFMSNKYIKPLTLFYRIAYRVTENVYKNAYKPMQRGNVAPMARYLSATLASGFAIEQMYIKMFNVDTKTYESAGERLWRLFVKGEGLGFFSGLGETDRNFRQATTPAILQFGEKLIGGLTMIHNGVWNAETSGEEEILIEEGVKQVARSVPLWNDIIRTIENNSYDISLPKLGIRGKKAIQEVKNVRSKISNYEKNVRGLEKNFDFTMGEAQNKMYQKISANLYANIPMEEKVNDVYATIHFVAHQHEINNPGRTTSRKSFNYAYNRVLEYLKNNTVPVNLSKKRTQGRTKSDYKAFTETLTAEEMAMVKELEKMHKKNYRGLRRQIVMKRNFYMRDLK